MSAISSSLAFMMPGTQELLIIAAVLILFFGAARIPRLMRGFGEGIREFRKGMDTPSAGDEVVKGSK
jgi:sec-independent protein translocase protein TatA